MGLTAQLPPTSTRVEQNTKPELNEFIGTPADAAVAALERGTPVEFRARLSELDREWDIERVLQANASTLVIIGTMLAITVDKRFFMLPAAVFSFFLQHALQGWCPPVPALRRLGVRTAREIDRERYAIKALRGDFDRIPMARSADRTARVRAVLEAVDA
jgi:hypothetical protein